MTSIQIEILSTDGFILQHTASYFVRETGASGGYYHTRVKASSQDPRIYVKEYIATSIKNNNCLVNPTTNKSGESVGILRSRQNSLKTTNLVKSAFSETLNYNESRTSAAVRGITEELGCVIDASFFFDTGSVFQLVIQDTAKDTIIDNYKSLVPLTEVYDVDWVKTTNPLPNIKVVQSTDIAQSNLIPIIAQAYIDLQSSTTFPALKIEQGGDVLDPVKDSNAYKNCDHNILSKPLRSIPVPPPAPAPAPVPAPTTPSYPSPNPGETREEYIARVGKLYKNSAREFVKFRNYANAYKFNGGKTIRKKKSKRSKKRGTLRKYH